MGAWRSRGSIAAATAAQARQAADGDGEAEGEEEVAVDDGGRAEFGKDFGHAGAIHAGHAEDALALDFEFALLREAAEEERFERALDAAAVHRRRRLRHARQARHLLDLVLAPAAHQIAVHAAEADGVHLAIVFRDQPPRGGHIAVGANAFQMKGHAGEGVVGGLVSLGRSQADADDVFHGFGSRVSGLGFAGTALSI